MRALVTGTIYEYLTPQEADACRSYRLAFASEYQRLQDRETDDLAPLRYWSELAHRAALMRCRPSAA